MSAENEKSGRLARADRWALAALLLGVAARIWGAWACRFLVVPDTAVVGLMARHMAALKEFPVFFYGQAYMGSLEPMASALLVRLLGPTGFAVTLGPVLFSAAALFFLWRWARDAAGPWGGFAALVAGGFGPAVYFHFQMAPRGGYMVALFVDALVLWAAARLAARLRAGEKAAARAFLGLGLAAGIGMWSNLIVAPALLAAVCLLLHGMRGRFWRQAGGLAAGLAGFVAGFSPWLVYNASHGWASLEMSQLAAREPMARAALGAWNRFLMLQSSEIGSAGARLPLMLALAVLGLAALGAGLAVAQGRRASLRENYARAGAILFCAIFAWVFATSGFARTRTARYWVPAVPGLAVLAAIACAAPGGRVRRGAAWTGLAVLTVAQGFAAAPAVFAFARNAGAAVGAYREMGAVLDRIGADALMAPIQFFPMNFELQERFAVSDGRQTFYAPILRRLELSDSLAYSSDYKGIEAFLRRQGAEWDSAPAGGRSLIWNVRFPPVSVREIPADRTAGLRDASGADWKEALSDRNLDTAWSPGGADAALEWTFAEPQDVHSVRLGFAHGMGAAGFDFPRAIRIEAKIAGEWRPVLADEPLLPLEVSGPRLYFTSGFARPEFPVGAQGAEALRIALLNTQSPGRSRGWRLAELNAFAAEAGAPPPMSAAPLEETLRRRPPETLVFAPRWLSNQLLKLGLVPEDRLPGLAAGVFGSPEAVPRDGAVPADRPGWFFVEPRNAAAARATLAAQCRVYREEEAGAWTLFAVAAGGWEADGLDLPLAARWTGDTLLAGATAARAGEALRRLRAGGEPEDAQQALLGEIVRWRPSALSGLSPETVARLGGEAALAARRAAARLPEKPCVTEFVNGLRLEGVAAALEDREAVVRLYWSAAENFKPAREIVFIHLRAADGKIAAQDDYRGSPLLWDEPDQLPPAGECVEETRRIVLPAGISPGALSLSVGLYRPGNGRRVKVLRSEAPAVHRNAPAWPGLLRPPP